MQCERYIVDKLLGEGGFSTVYLVHDRRMKNNFFALKVIIYPNKRQYKNFTFEGELLQHLDHPHLPRVYHVFTDEKQRHLYMLMDYIDGPNLEHLRVQQPEQRFSFSQTLQIMAPIIEAVIYLHTQTPPIIHRDIKPANIIVPNSGDGAVLIDLGIAKAYDLNATTTAIRHCSPSYSAPEQYVCHTNPRTDIYGLGATFYTLLTGTVPIDSLYRLTSLSTKGTDPLIPINNLTPELPAPVADIIQHALALNSDDRFTSVEAFWQALKAYDPEKVTPSPLTGRFLVGTGVSSPITRLLRRQTPVRARPSRPPGHGHNLPPKIPSPERTPSLPIEGLLKARVVPTPRPHSLTEILTIGRILALLPTAPIQRNLLQPTQITSTNSKHGQIFTMKLILLIILALSAGVFKAVFENIDKSGLL